MLKEKKILIVGAGPAGLTTALLLARNGNIPRIVEKREAASTLSRAVGIFPKTLKVLPKELADEIVEHSVVIGSAKIYRNDRLMLGFEFPLDVYQQPCGYPQNKTEELLRNDFVRYGGRVEYGVEFQGLVQHHGRVITTLNAKEEVFDIVVGADGLDSQVRESIGQEHKGFTLEDKWSIADFHADNLDQSLNIWLLDKGDFVGYVPIEKDRYRLFASTEDALETIPKKVNVTKMNREGVFRVSVRKADHFNVGNVYLMGDAAHIHTPLGGRGMNLAMQDSAEFVERCLSGSLDGYSKSRREKAVATANTTERMRLIFSSNKRFVVILRTAVFRLIASSTMLKKIFASRFVQM